MGITQITTLGGHRLSILVALVAFPCAAVAQGGHPHPTPPPKTSGDTMQMAGMADHAMSGPMDENMMKHMELSPPRAPTHADTIKATKVAADLKRAIAKYEDTTAAVADGYKMFAPNVKNQHVYHFTNNAHAIGAVFKFDPAKPTSILYKKEVDGKLHLIGAMYTMPKGAKLSRLDDRVPLSIARWHKHVNWCIPKKGDETRWLETKNGKPVFGPESPIATQAECDAVHGNFLASPLGWMVHVNVFEGDDLATIFGDDHHRM
jgi:hypothetical protein